jgi:glucose/arabinose dehydrogenase/type 1 glutamine amidotransferase
MVRAKGLSSARRGVCLLAMAVAAVLIGAVPAHAAPGRVLVFHPDPAGHPEVAAGATAMSDIGRAAGLRVDDTTKASDFTGSNLRNYRAVVFLNTFGERLNGEQEGALADYMQSGGGFFGIGSAAEGEPGSALFDELIGARPDASSATGVATRTVEVGDRVHPSTRALPLELNRTDVWYRWQTRPTGTVHTVARWRNLEDPAGDGTSVGGTDHPISWCRDVRGGRSFYTGMGRTAGSYSEAAFRTHLRGALEWSAGLVRGGCKATINSNYRGTRLVSGGPLETGLATAGESHGLTIAPNGWVIYIGRGDCRTDQERGALINLPALGRILDHSSENVGLGCGSVHVFDPSQYNGTVNSGVTRAATLAVYGDGGQGGERTNTADHKLEWGLLGVTTAPDFTATGHIYLQYFPSFNPNSKPPGLPIERRISKMERPRISRFTMNLATKTIDLNSEVRIFEYDSQIFSCCHVGGGMGFDSAGDLYVTTGDTNSSQGTGGYSGNNPDAKCPTGPPDEASSAHCGSNAISYQDARRTAGNTNDYNGKMLRIKPNPSIPDGTQPPVGVGTTYTIPGATAPNGPNLFDGTEGGGGKTRPEIFAMGLRNPSRLSIDPKTDTVYSAWVGPDAGSPSQTLGPSTYENAAQISHAGNYGWPYCMGDKQAYRDRVPGNTPRTDSPEGYVPGGPASGGTEGWYDCDNLRNDSPNNTGLTVLPHVTGTGMDAGKVRGTNVWYSRGNPGNTNGCPEFPRERGADGAPNYGATPRQLCPYALAQGATIMDGPLYRYNATATDNEHRWPAYWDGRWFLHNHGGASIKHGLLLDPATDQDGGQPVYADSLRNTLSWQGNYMDSKFGPDGALYVQVYDGFFRAGPNVGLYRFDYVGGADTPGSDPQATPNGNRKVTFSIGKSGGVSYSWQFGDGSTSTSEAPSHTYGAAGTYDVTLTVTYADGAKSSKTIQVPVA